MLLAKPARLANALPPLPPTIPFCTELVKVMVPPNLIFSLMVVLAPNFTLVRLKAELGMTPF